MVALDWFKGLDQTVGNDCMEQAPVIQAEFLGL